MSFADNSYYSGLKKAKNTPANFLACSVGNFNFYFNNGNGEYR